MNNKKLFLIYFIFLFFFPTKVNSSCNFRTAEYINNLKIPKEIREIKITIPKSKTYIRNSLKILLSEGYNIDPKLRKKYKANITVNYLLENVSIKLRFGRTEITRITLNGDLLIH